MGNNVEKSYRELQVAARVAWARKARLHPRAIDYAARYLNLDNQMLELISAYETAFDLPAEPPLARVIAMRAAWDAVIRYVRLLSRKEENEAA